MIFGLFRSRRQAPLPALAAAVRHRWIAANGAGDVVEMARNRMALGAGLFALAFGARVDLIERIAPGEGYDGAFRERGFCAVDLEAEANGIFADLPETLDVWESHCDEVKNLPNDFLRTATNDVSEIQAMQHRSLPLFGVQFHPELFDDEHGHGRTILENFLKL